MRRSWFSLALVFPLLAASHLPPVNLAKSVRLESLLRAGRLYFSLVDCLALAFENNLDIAIQRYGPRIEEAQPAGSASSAHQTVATGDNANSDGDLVTYNENVRGRRQVAGMALAARPTLVQDRIHNISTEEACIGIRR